MAAPNPIKSVAIYVGERVTDRWWIQLLATFVGSAGFALFLAFPKPWTCVVGVLVFGLSMIPDASLRHLHHVTAQENADAVAQYHLITTNALAPLSELIAQLITDDASDADQTFGQLINQVTGSCVLPFDNALNVRSCLYALSDDLNSMTCISWAGRAQEAKPFMRGTHRGNKAFAALQDSKPIFVPDLSKSTPREWAGSGDGYQTFITVAVADATGAYGLLTVDCPTAESFTDSDVLSVTLVARLAAVAFAFRDTTIRHNQQA